MMEVNLESLFSMTKEDLEAGTTLVSYPNRRRKRYDGRLDNGTVVRVIEPMAYKRKKWLVQVVLL